MPKKSGKKAAPVPAPTTATVAGVVHFNTLLGHAYGDPFLVGVDGAHDTVRTLRSRLKRKLGAKWHRAWPRPDWTDRKSTRLNSSPW